MSNFTPRPLALAYPGGNPLLDGLGLYDLLGSLISDGTYNYYSGGATGLTDSLALYDSSGGIISQGAGLTYTTGTQLSDTASLYYSGGGALTDGFAILYPGTGSVLANGSQLVDPNAYTFVELVDGNSQWGFFGANTVPQPDAIDDITGGSTVDTECRTKVNTLFAALRSLGLIAS